MRNHPLTKAIDANDTTKAHAIVDAMAERDLRAWMRWNDPNGEFDDLDLDDLRANARYIIDGSL